MRKILHVDMDAFYASVEQRDRPELRGRPVVVGGSPEGRGVVAAASYEARKFGIRSAMSAKKALGLCPSLVFVRPSFQKYSAVSQQIREIFKSVTPWVEPLSLDEAYLDVTENSLGEPLAKNVARYIKDKIRLETGLTASAGAGPNKFIAKIASDLRKPDGLVVIPPEKVDEFLKTLPVEKLWGVGPVTAKKLRSLGFETAGQIRDRSQEELCAHLGKFGIFLHGLSRGIDERPVEVDGVPKSHGTEETFESDLLDLERLMDTLKGQSQSLSDDLKRHESYAKTLTLKVRYRDFKTITRSRTWFAPTDRAETLFETAVSLLNQTEAGDIPVRLLGLSVSQLIGKDDPIQLWLEFKI